MENYNCNQLKNIEIPEGWIENALNIPSKNNKAPAPVRLYRYAAGIAACIVIAAAVMFSTLFGINKNVKLTDPHPNPSQADNISGGTSSDTTDSTISPSGIPPALFGAESQNPTVVTEPSENSGNSVSNGNNRNRNSNSKQQTTTPNGKSKKSNSTTGSNSLSSDTGYDEPGEDETPGEDIGEPTVVEEDPYEEPWYEERTEQPTSVEPCTAEPCADPNVERTTADPYAERKYEFSAVVFKGKAKGDVYFKLTDQNGTVIAGGLVTDKTPYEGKTRISYSVYMKPKAGNTYTWVFYASNGTVLKQESFYIR